MDDAYKSNIRHSTPYLKKKAFSCFLKVTFAFAVVNILYYCLMCSFSVFDAVDDYKKYSGLGVAYPISHYLRKNEFDKYMGKALLVTCEFSVFCLFRLRSNNINVLRAFVYCFTLMLVCHFSLWLYMCSLEFPESPPFVSQNGLTRLDYVFSLHTFVQSLLYFLSAVIGVRNVKRTKTESGDVSSKTGDGVVSRINSNS